MKKTAKIVALGEWLMVLPATVFLAAAALRLLQPRQFEPSRTSWAIFDWTVNHVSNFGAAVLFALLPGLVVASGCALLFRMWRLDAAFRQDAVAGWGIVRRNGTVILLASATLLAGAILIVSVGHMITG